MVHRDLSEKAEAFNQISETIVNVCDLCDTFSNRDELPIDHCGSSEDMNGGKKISEPDDPERSHPDVDSDRGLEVAMVEPEHGSLSDLMDVDALIRREIPKSTGFYVEGVVQGVDMLVTVDTGAESTLLRRDAYLGISEKRRPKLLSGCAPGSANGVLMKC